MNRGEQAGARSWNLGFGAGASGARRSSRERGPSTVLGEALPPALRGGLITWNAVALQEGLCYSRYHRSPLGRELPPSAVSGLSPQWAGLGPRQAASLVLPHAVRPGSPPGNAFTWRCPCSHRGQVIPAEGPTRALAGRRETRSRQPSSTGEPAEVGAMAHRSCSPAPAAGGGGGGHAGRVACREHTCQPRWPLGQELRALSAFRLQLFWMWARALHSSPTPLLGP